MRRGRVVRGLWVSVLPIRAIQLLLLLLLLLLLVVVACAASRQRGVAIRMLW